MILDWHDARIDGGPPISTSLTQTEADRLTKLATGRHVLEIGSAYGYSALCMARSARTVTAIDPHPKMPWIATALAANIASHEQGARVTLIHEFSSSALPGLPRNHFGLAFIDADHAYDAVRSDVTGAWALLRRGGILAAHDYGEETCPGVRDFLDEWAKPDELVDTLWIRRKP